MVGTFVIMFFGMLAVTAGGMLGELIHHTAKGELVRFFGQHPIQAYLTIGVTLAAVFFLRLNVRAALAERAKVIEQRAMGGVAFGVTGVSYITTPAMRAAVFVGMYVLGVGCSLSLLNRGIREIRGLG